MTTDSRNYHKKFITEFIEMYKSQPTLWNLKCTEYNDRDLKHDAYIKLVEKLKEVEPDCTKQDVIKKINSLRSAFRREFRKVLRMKACGRVYKPLLWYYDLISFTASESDAKFKDILAAEKANTTDSGPSLDPLTVTLIKEEDESCASYETEESKLMNTEDELTGQFLTHGEDEFDAIGRNVAFKLRNMERKQKIIAERIIAETLFQGQMGALSVNTSPSDFTPTRHHKGDANPNFSLLP